MAEEVFSVVFHVREDDIDGLASILCRAARGAALGEGVDQCVELLAHREKAGTIEHVHRSMKDELGAGILPCQKFGANAAWFRINVLTYNVLTFLKRSALPDRYRDARPQRLRFEAFTMLGRLTFHQRQTSVNVSCDAQQIEEMVDAEGACSTSTALYATKNKRTFDA